MNFAQKITAACGGRLDTPNTDREEAMFEAIQNEKDRLLGLRAADVITDFSMHEKETSALSDALECMEWDSDAFYFLSLEDILAYAKPIEPDETVQRIIAATQRLAEAIVAGKDQSDKDDAEEVKEQLLGYTIRSISELASRFPDEAIAFHDAIRDAILSLSHGVERTVGNREVAAGVYGIELGSVLLSITGQQKANLERAIDQLALAIVQSENDL